MSRRPLALTASARSDGVGASFGQLLDQWLEECERLDLSPTTIRNYRAQVERTIRPILGKVTLSRLTAKNLDAPPLRSNEGRRQVTQDDP